MTDFHLNKSHKFFHFQTRIFRSVSAPNPIAPSIFWEKILVIIDELQKSNEADIYGLVWEGDNLKVIFSTPYFNENILMLEWEIKLKNEFNIQFERPILCEPIASWAGVKLTLFDFYRAQLDIHHGKIHWRSPFNSLKMILDGHRYSRLFKDPFRVVFQPQIVFQIADSALVEAK